MALFFYCVTLLAITILILSLKVLREDERLVMIRLGRFLKIAGPGIVMILPWIDRGIRVDLSREFPGWQGLSKMDLEEKIKAFALRKL